MGICWGSESLQIYALYIFEFEYNALLTTFKDKIISIIYIGTQVIKKLPKGYDESIFKVLMLKLQDLATASLISLISDIPSQPLIL